MKKLIALAALAVSTPAMGANLSSSDLRFCKLIGMTAKMTMTARQDGIATTTIYETFNEIFEKDKIGMMKIVALMIRETYAKPPYFSDNLKKKAISDYQTEQELLCFESVMETNRKAVK